MSAGVAALLFCDLFTRNRRYIYEKMFRSNKNYLHQKRKSDIIYLPRTVELDFGFMTSDNVFHFTKGSDRSIRTTIQINETGKYYFEVRNNASNTVEALGYWSVREGISKVYCEH